MSYLDARILELHEFAPLTVEGVHFDNFQLWFTTNRGTISIAEFDWLDHRSGEQHEARQESNFSNIAERICKTLDLPAALEFSAKDNVMLIGVGDEKLQVPLSKHGYEVFVFSTDDGGYIGI